jgi:hypothetical protein
MHCFSTNNNKKKITKRNKITISQRIAKLFYLQKNKSKNLKKSIERKKKE